MTFPILGGNSAVGGYEIANSLRFNDNDSAYLSRTPSSAGNRKTWTWSGWVKRGNLNLAEIELFHANSSGTTENDFFHFNSDNTLQFRIKNSNSVVANLKTNQLFRDVSAWYHIVLQWDSTQATASNRIKMYVNGQQITSFSSSTYPSQNTDTSSFNNTVLHTIGSYYYASTFGGYFDGYMAEVNFIDGQALSPTDFGEFDEDSGIWKPIEYTGTYGTNGFYLDFENSGSLGADQSGNGNNFTPTNLASTDQVLDSPTNNFATLNALDKDGHTNSEGNLKVSGNVIYGMQRGTTGVSSGKWYFEARLNVYQNDTAIALANEIENVYTRFTGETTNSVGYLADGRFFYNSSSTTYSSASGGNILQMAFDADTGKIWVGINNTWQNSGNPSAGTNELQTVSWNTFIPTARTVSTGELIFNFGQEGSFAGTATAQGNTDANGYGDFYYAPPSGYLALCTQNLATALSPTIDDGSQYFNTITYTANRTARSLTGVGFQPDWVWIKDRGGAQNNALFDSNRGVNKQLRSDTTGAELTAYSNLLTSFDSDGFSLGTDSNVGDVNYDLFSHVAWNWKAGGTGVSNTDGSITSTISANPTAGFSIVTWTGSGANATIGHGLSVQPYMVIVKNRTDSTNWRVHHNSIGATNILYLNLTNSQTVSDIFQNTFPTSSVFSVSGNNDVNGSGDNMIAYCFAEIEGYSSINSYTGNGSTDGTFVYTGFRPAFVMVKVTNTTNNWMLWDNKRSDVSGANVNGNMLRPNLSDAELTDDDLDFTSNGFKWRRVSAGFNGSGNSYIYMAFAENPFVSSTGIPVVAR